jgi:hypothetical protein
VAAREACPSRRPVDAEGQCSLQEAIYAAQLDARKSTEMKGETT